MTSQSATDSRQPVAFSWAGFRRGAALSIPFGASSFVYGIAFGVLASDAGLSAAEAMLMSLLVFSGTAQMAVLQMGAGALAVLPIFFTVLAVNARYVLMGAVMRPWLAAVNPLKAVGSIFFLVDGSFALASRERAAGNTDGAIFLGSSAVSYSGWVIATGLGFVVGRRMGDPRLYGLDFILVAFCASAASMMWRGRKDVLPVAVATVAAVLVDRVGGGAWAVAAAGVAGAMVGAMRHVSQR